AQTVFVGEATTSAAAVTRSGSGDTGNKVVRWEEMVADGRGSGTDQKCSKNGDEMDASMTTSELLARLAKLQGGHRASTALAITEAAYDLLEQEDVEEEVEDVIEESTLAAELVEEEAAICKQRDVSATLPLLPRQRGDTTEEGSTTGEENTKQKKSSQLEFLLPFVRVFGRTKPDGKKRIVERLQRSGNVVAMCGDGGNDSAALRQAHVGVAICAAPDDEQGDHESKIREDRHHDEQQDEDEFVRKNNLQEENDNSTAAVSAIAPFVATDPSIYTSVAKLVVEGRCCLENSVIIVLFFNIVGLSWCLGPKFLVQAVGAFMPMGMWFYVDAVCFMGLPFAIAQLEPAEMGRGEAAESRGSKNTP
ncbi:unnamed protein product, partial [Amoebophrya sp. A25]